MNSLVRLGIPVLALAVVPCVVGAQQFTSGSNGSFGPINVTEGVLTIDLPANGIINATTVTVGPSGSLRFNRNALNTPVFLLATGNIDIQGPVDVSAQATLQGAPIGGLGGPGGFDGGTPGLAGAPPGDGHGPGAGRGGERLAQFPDPASAGSASYGGTPTDLTTLDGGIYGSPLLIPLVGGSGGGGSTVGDPGGGGGGAILFASSTRVNISNIVFARGGASSASSGHGSGGAIRIVAPVVSGSGVLDVFGGGGGDTGGHGRVRIDLIDRSQLTVFVSPTSAALSIGSFMAVFPPVIPRLDLVNVAGQAIAVGTPNAVQILLPFGAPQTQSVTVQARDFTGVVPVDVVVTPANGPRTVVQTTIDMSTGNPAQRTVNVTIPVNVVTQINAWTR
jgi:hypothetical protein